MRLPSLTNWEETAQSLHQVTVLMGAIRRLLLPHVPNYLELALQIKPAGMSTGRLPSGVEVSLDMPQAALVFQPSTGDAVSIPLTEHSQASLFETLLAAFAAQGQALALETAEHPSLTEAFLAALQAKGHRPIPLSETPLQVRPELAADYAQVLYRIFTATARFRARLGGPMTPIVVWPEHFDLSFLWFATENATEAGPHLNFGFAPYSPGLERPYLYSYAHPLPADFGSPPLPPLATWHTAGWTGVVVPYDELVKMADPEAAIEETFAEIYQALLPLLLG
jgi:hypothetical protein